MMLIKFIFGSSFNDLKQLRLFLPALLLAYMASAQSITSKKGEPILPEKGNWGVFFDGAPFIKYAGNLLNSSQSNSVKADFPNGYKNTLVLKKYKSDTRALRIKMRIGFSSNTIDSIVTFLGGIYPEPTVTDSRNISEKNIVVGIGTQKSRGKGRLTGYLGKELLFGFSTLDTTYTYGGGPLTQYNWLHTNTFGQERGVTKIERGTDFRISLHIVAGVEYFFAPRMSLSAEYSWGFGYQNNSAGKITKEEWNFQGGNIKTTTRKTAGSSSFIVDNANNVGSINLAVYF